ncbi:MAG: hypothetical protein IPM24_07340 [Bryobacterales bacterium]|nr:hypothetical protein [Bryobacterales bacterium]
MRMLFALLAAIPAAAVTGAPAVPLAFAPSGSGFSAAHRGMSVTLTPQAAAIGLPRGTVRLRLLGAAQEPRIEGADALAARASFFTGADARLWRRAVPLYGAVAYRGVYAGIDMLFHGRQGDLEFDFEVAPGADPSSIRFSVEGAVLGLETDGDLLIETGGDTLRLRRPVAWQDIPHGRREVACGFRLRDGSVAFVLGPHDPASPLTIDPRIVYTTELTAGSVQRLAGAPDGSVIAAGVAFGASPPVAEGLGNPYNRPLTHDVYSVVTKLSPDGAAIQWSAYFGGTGNTSIAALHVDSLGQVTAAGLTNSWNFPVSPGAFRRTPPPGGLLSAFVVRLTADGSDLVFGTYVNTFETLDCLAVDPGGYTVVAGGVFNGQFRTQPGAFRREIQPPDGRSAGVVRLNPSGSAVVYATLFGGRGGDLVSACASDEEGNLLLAGLTSSEDFPLVSPLPFQRDPASLIGYLARLDATGSRLLKSTYFSAGALLSRVVSIALDPSGRVYLGGAVFGSVAGVQPMLEPRPGGAEWQAFTATLAPGISELLSLTPLPIAGSAEFPQVALDGPDTLLVAGPSRDSVLRGPGSIPPEPGPPALHVARFDLRERRLIDAAGLVPGSAIAFAGETVFVAQESGVTRFDWPNPVPRLRSVRFLAPGPDHTPVLWGDPVRLIVAGTGFVTGTQLEIDGSPATTEVLSGSRIALTIPAESGASYRFRAHSPDPGGGVSNEVTLAIPRPPLDDVVLSPTHLPVLPSGATEEAVVRVRSVGIVPSTQVLWNGAPRPAHLVRRMPGVVELTVTAAERTRSAQFEIRLVNAPPGGGSAAVHLLIQPASDPVPPPVRPNAVSPRHVEVTPASVTVTVVGTGFTPSTAVRYRGSGRATRLVGESAIEVTLEPGDLAIPGVHWLTIEDPSLAAPVRLPVLCYRPAPRVSSPLVSEATDRLYGITDALELVSIDPATGEVLSLNVPRGMRRLVLTADGEHLYGLSSDRVVRVRLRDEAVTLDFSLTIPAAPSSIHPLPGSPESFLVAGIAEFAIYDDSRRRPLAPPGTALLDRSLLFSRSHIVAGAPLLDAAESCWSVFPYGSLGAGFGERICQPDVRLSPWLHELPFATVFDAGDGPQLVEMDGLAAPGRIEHSWVGSDRATVAVIANGALHEYAFDPFRRTGRFAVQDPVTKYRDGWLILLPRGLVPLTREDLLP